MYQDIYHVYKDGNKLDTHGNEFGYLGYPFFCFLPVSTLRMETDGIGMEIDLDILDIHFHVSLPFPSLAIVNQKRHELSQTWL